MNFSSIGDLSKSFQLRRDTGRIKSDLSRLTRELSSGVSDNLVGKFKGNFGPLAGIERGIQRTESFGAVVAEQALTVASLQQTLGNLRTLGDVSGALLTVPDTGDAVLIRAVGGDAEARFVSAVNNLNNQSGGRTVFAGVATDGPALADSETIFLALEAEIALAGAVTAADVATVVDTWFAAGGGFDTVGYIGGAPAADGAQLSDTETAPPLPTADENAIRDYLAGLAMGGLLGRDVLATDVGEQGLLAQMSGERLFAADSGLIDLQSSVGIIESQIERARTEVQAEGEGLRIARADLIEVDGYDAAVKLQNAELQLETLYAVTARLSRLSLTGYLR